MENEEKGTCKYFRRGYCRAAERCPYRHDINPHVPSAPPRSSSTSNSATSAPPCKYFARGHCKEGSRCAYSHHQPQPRPPRNPPTREEDEEDPMEFSSSGDEDELHEADAMLVEGTDRGSACIVSPYQEKSLFSSLLGPLTRGPGPARLLTIAAFEERRKALGDQARRVRIVCLSDTHMKHAFLTPFMPQGEDDHILLHAGDFTSLGRLQNVLEFNDWLGTLRYRHKFLVSGNHERVCGDVRHHSAYADLLTNGTYVTHGCITLEEFGGLTIFLSSWERMRRDRSGSTEPELFPWDHPSLRERGHDDDDDGDGGDEDGDDRRERPRGVDVLVTHQPPRGILDTARLVKHRGSRRLLERVERMRPTVHLFGHVHRSGVEVRNGTTFINAANPAHAGPIVFDYYY